MIVFKSVVRNLLFNLDSPKNKIISFFPSMKFFSCIFCGAVKMQKLFSFSFLFNDFNSGRVATFKITSGDNFFSLL